LDVGPATLAVLVAVFVIGASASQPTLGALAHRSYWVRQTKPLTCADADRDSGGGNEVVSSARRECVKAIVQDTYGSTDVLELRDIDKPEIADGEVLVRVHAAGVDRGVWHLMAGLPYPVRLAGCGLRAPKTQVPGMDLAGVVDAVGKDVTRFQPGDEVFGVGKGSFAEYARASEDKLALKPKTSRSHRRRWSPSPARPRCRDCATRGGLNRGRRC
jgi:hypothetical protein